MGVFILSDEVRAEARRVREFAERRENWYVPGQTTIPGDDPRYVFHSGNNRIVFSWTVFEGQTFRHLSVSVSAPGKAPNPMVVFTVAHLMGFTGVEPDKDGFVHTFGDDWRLGRDVEGNAAVVQEQVPDALA